MCEFMSSIEVQKGGKTHLLYLDDDALFKADGSHSDRVQELLKDSKDNDFLGHGAIRVFHGLKEKEGREHETQDFWNKEKLPQELCPRFKDSETVLRHFGRMLKTYAQPDDLDYIMVKAPKTSEWSGMGLFARETLYNQRKAIVDKLVKSATVEKFKIGPDNGISVEELRKAGGYDYQNENITTANFPAKATPETEAILIDFHDEVESWDADLAAGILGYRLGTARETLRLGKAHPDLQRKVWIVGLGEEWQDPGGNRHVVVLRGSAGSRRANLYCRPGRWFRDFRFLAFASSSGR